MYYIVLAVILLVVLFGLASLFMRADPAKLARVLKVTGGVLALAIGGLLTMRGNAGIGLLLVALGLGLLGKGSWLASLGLPGMGGGAGGRRSDGQRSRVATRMLSMELDHDTGDMDGEVLEGPFAGRRLSSLSFDELMDLYQQCVQVPDQSAALLATHLDRSWPEWRAGAGAPGAGTTGNGSAGAASGGPMSQREAREVLGLAEGAGEAEIQAAHRKLMKQYHPDRGGSAYLAAKINEAKEVLMGRR